VTLSVQILVAGLAAGSVYGLFALAHSIVFRLTGTINFAFGDLMALGVFATLVVATGGGPSSQTSVGGLRFLLALAIGLAVCVAAGAGTYVAAVQPYAVRGWTVGWVAATVALGFAIRALLDVYAPTQILPDPLPFDRVGRAGVVTIAGASVQVRSFFVLGVALALAAAASAFLARTRVGKALRAIADDASAARTVGLPVDRLLALAFALVGGLAALGAIAAAPRRSRRSRPSPRPQARRFRPTRGRCSASRGSPRRSSSVSRRPGEPSRPGSRSGSPKPSWRTRSSVAMVP
jgi:branched-chain amino acid transport system permease protein